MPINGILEGAVYFLAINLICFALFAWDKRQAQRNGQRVPERRLLMFVALGGSVGGILARTYLRHKTVKEPFSTIFNIICVVHAGLVVLALVMGMNSFLQ